MRKFHLLFLPLLLILSGFVRPVAADDAKADRENDQGASGSIQGQVVDSSGAAITAAKVTLSNAVTGFQINTETDQSGGFKFFTVPFNEYKISVEAAGFQTVEQGVDLHSSVPAQVTITLKVAAINEQVSVTAEQTNQVDSDQTSSDTALNTSMVGKLIGPAQAKGGLEKLVQSAPGIVVDDNSRIHARGSEANVSTVVNGIPITDNMSAIFSTSIDPKSASQVEVLTGGIPAEFGDKLGAVVNLTTKSGLDMPISGEISGGIGSFVTGDMDASFGGHTGKFGWFTAFSGSTSHRYLDPPSVDNFHNVGRTVSNLTTLDYNPTSNDFFKVTLMFGGSNFFVPNRLDQEIAGQDQRQHLRSYSESISWHHLFNQTTLADFSFFHRTSTANLNSNPLSNPVVAFQDRTLTNYGFIGALSYVGHGQTIKTGFQYTRTPINENFSFYPTDPNAFAPVTTLTGQVVPNPVLQFSAASPFVFNGRQAGNEVSW
ncbi:MAG: carboxypeptidase regulatory-like domain-containing protein, partial [Blastocatellia bacterium]